MSRRRAFISGRVSWRPARTEPWRDMVARMWFSCSSMVLAAADLGEFAQYVFGERDDVGLPSMAGTARTARVLPPMSDSSSPEACQCVGVVGEGGAFFVGRGEGNGDEQALALQVAVSCRWRFIFHELTRSAARIVDEQQAVFGLGEDVMPNSWAMAKPAAAGFSLGSSEKVWAGVSRRRGGRGTEAGLFELSANSVASSAAVF